MTAIKDHIHNHVQKVLKTSPLYNKVAEGYLIRVKEYVPDKSKHSATDPWFWAGWAYICWLFANEFFLKVWENLLDIGQLDNMHKSSSKLSWATKFFLVSESGVLSVLSFIKNYYFIQGVNKKE